ncbi:MAG: glycosyltransferase family 4 protein [Chloroflexi bacterium]|nr:glycosyltransferase family 4 protein [Chloroflexota bacterium]
MRTPKESSKLIYLDVSSAVHQKAGLRRYTENLARALQPILGERLALFQNGLGKSVPLAGFEAHRTIGVHQGYKPWRAEVLARQLVHLNMDKLLPDAGLFHATEHLLLPLAHIPTVLTVHDLVFQRYPEYHKRFNYLYLRTAMPVFCKRATGIIAVSSSTKNDLITYYHIPSDKIVAIPEAAAPQFCPQDQAFVESVRRHYGLSARYILTVGTIEPRKNLSRLLDACVPILAENLADSLVVVGREGWLYDDFNRHLEEYPYPKRVQRLGFVSEQELPALYAGAAVTVQPSLYEGFGLPVLEAMGCGSPVCTSQVSSLPEVGGNAALYFDPLSVNAITECIRQVLSDRALESYLRSASLQRAALFSWQKTAEKTLALYEQLMK